MVQSLWAHKVAIEGVYSIEPDQRSEWEIAAAMEMDVTPDNQISVTRGIWLNSVTEDFGSKWTGADNDDQDAGNIAEDTAIKWVKCCKNKINH